MVCQNNTPLKCQWNEIFGYRFIALHKRPFNTKKNAIYRFSMSFLVPEFFFQSFQGLKIAKSA